MPLNSGNAAINEAYNPEIKSPDYLGHKPKNNAEVVRIGRKPIILVGLCLSGIAGVMTYTVVMKSIAAQRLAEEDSERGELVTNSIPILEKKPSAGLIEIPTNNNAIVDSKAKEGSILQVPPPVGDSQSAKNPYDDAEFQMWQQREQERLQLEQAKRSELKTALNADTTAYANNSSINNQNGNSFLYGSVKKEEIDYSKPQQSSVNIPKEPTDSGNYLLHTRSQSASQYELTAGTVIPSVMLGGINSDLPGQIMGQVSQNVYDSATGQYLLIPQGVKLVGNYDHQIVQGQNRVLIIWHRLIYPDASAVNLEAMSGADESGYSGFKDKVNAHFWPTFRNALMLSLITAGTQLSQPQAKNGSSYSSQQVLAAGMGQQMNNLGLSTLNRNLSRPPTIEVRPGYIFNVLINKDMILPPWQPDSLAYGDSQQ
jgi:type IV secretion system protein VirB10